MATALTEYLTTTASGTISTANQLLENVSTTGTLLNKNTNLTASTTGWVMINSQGTATSQTGVGSEIAPNGLGWFDDGTTLVGNQFVAGVWTFKLGFEMGTTGGTYIADVHFRAYIYNGSTYSLICEATASSQTVTNASYNVVSASTTTGAASSEFLTGNKLYIDCQHNITTNSTSANLRMQSSNSATLGNVSAEAVTPGYQTFVPPSSGVVIISDGYGGVFV